MKSVGRSTACPRTKVVIEPRVVSVIRVRLTCAIGRRRVSRRCAVAAKKPDQPREFFRVKPL